MPSWGIKTSHAVQHGQKCNNNNKALEETLAGNRMYYRGDHQLKNKKCTNFNVRTSVHEIIPLGEKIETTIGNRFLYMYLNVFVYDPY